MKKESSRCVCVYYMFSTTPLCVRWDYMVSYNRPSRRYTIPSKEYFRGTILYRIWSCPYSQAENQTFHQLWQTEKHQADPSSRLSFMNAQATLDPTPLPILKFVVDTTGPTLIIFLNPTIILKLQMRLRFARARFEWPSVGCCAPVDCEYRARMDYSGLEAQSRWKGNTN